LKIYRYPPEDDATNRERFERTIPADLKKTFETFVTYVWFKNAGVGPASWIEVTKKSTSPSRIIETGMERKVVGGFDEEITRVVEPKLIEYHIKDGLPSTYHLGRVIFKPNSVDEKKTDVVWTILWSPTSTVSSITYSLMIKGFCSLALFQLERQINGTAKPVAADETIDDATAAASSSGSGTDETGSSGLGAGDIMAAALKDGEKPKLQFAARLQTGYEGNLTPDQEQGLKQLEEMLKQKDSDAWQLCQTHPDGPKRVMLRFLRAECYGKQRKFNVEKSFERLVHTLKWRREIGADGMLSKAPPHFDDFCKYGGELTVLDKEGRVVVFTRAGLLSTTMDTSVLTTEQWTTGLVCITERRMQELRESSKRMGHEVSATVVVYDLSGMGFASRKIIPFTKIINSVASVHYPELVDAIVMVNAPGIFTQLWNAVKGFLDPVTRSKVMIFGTSKKEKEKCETMLRALIDVKVLPKEYGGESSAVVPIPWHAAQKGMKVVGGDDA
jgi:hypothetical protein